MNTAGLLDWQKDHAVHMFEVLRTGNALDASDTGTGKTYIACAIARQLGVTPLVICPKTVIPSWEEAAAHIGVDIAPINYERVKTSGLGVLKKTGKGSRWVWNEAVALAIFDEVDRCSGDSTLNSKFLIAAKRQFSRTLALSATAADSPLRLKALGYLLGLHDLKDFRWFLLNNGCVPGTFGGFTFAGNASEQREAMIHIHGQIFPLRGGRLRKSEIPGFPEQQVGVVLIEDEKGQAEKLSAEMRDAYLFRRTQEEAAVAAQKAEAESAADDEERPNHRGLEILTRKRQALEILKVSALAELAIDHSRTSKVAIFVNYTETINALHCVLGKHFNRALPVINGETPSELRERWRAEFQQGGHPVILLNAAAGSVGISLHSPTGCFEVTKLASPMYSVRQMKQLKGRANRAGGGFSRLLWVYFSKGVEAKIAKVVAQKEGNLDALNDAELNGV